MPWQLKDAAAVQTDDKVPARISLHSLHLRVAKAQCKKQKLHVYTHGKPQRLATLTEPTIDHICADDNCKEHIQHNLIFNMLSWLACNSRPCFLCKFPLPLL